MSRQAENPPLPEYRFNTAVSCLASLAASLELELGFEQIAGMTGEAFRCPLFGSALPGSWVHSVSWPHAALSWTDALGIDAEIAWCDTAASGFDNWLASQRLRISETLASGLPVMYWDSLAFGMIYADDGNGYTVSGIPELHLPPDLQNAAGILSRCFSKSLPETERSFSIARSELAPLFEGEALFIYPVGLVHADPEFRLARALRRAGDELGGQVAWPHMADSSGHRLDPLFGTLALARLEKELKNGEVNLHGLIMALQTLYEMRRSAHGWLRQCAEAAPADYGQSLLQAAEFMRRIVETLRPVAGLYCLPADTLKQMKRESLNSAATAIYEVRRTEETLTRLLRGIAGDLGVFA